MPEKICPLSMSGNIEDPPARCEREKCGWWDEDAQACAMLVLTKSMKKVTKNAR